MNQNGQAKAEFRGYAISNITKEVKAKVKSAKTTESEIVGWVLSVASEGYKFSLAWEEDNNTYRASLYALYRDNDNAGLMLSTRHTDGLIAIKALMCLHDDVYEQQWQTKETFDW